jgi:hypothetical protein
MLLEEVKAAEAEKAEKEKVKGDDDVIEKDEKKESLVKERGSDNRDWKRNGGSPH